MIKLGFDELGKVHVVDSQDYNNVLTITSRRPSNTPHYVEDGLADYAKQIGFVKEHFGEKAAAIAFARPVDPLNKVSWWRRLRANLSSPQFKQTTRIRNMWNKLNGRRFGYFHNDQGDGKSVLNQEAHRDGTIRTSVTGALEDSAKLIHL